MREFNTSGPCDPALHYTVMREALIEEGKKKVNKGRFFTLFAPRQAGKTTYFQLLLQALEKDGLLPIWISFECLKTVSRAVFYRDLNNQLHQELAKYQIKLDQTIQDPVSLKEFFENIEPKQSIVLVIDEFEGIPDLVLSEVMHTFRQMYHRKQYHALRSLILVGVSTVAELVVSSASPFNIAEELQLPYFTEVEVRSLVEQYITESGQLFEESVIKRIDENTNGQPGLVCALCAYLVEKLALNRSEPVTIAHYYQAQHHFLTERFDKNIINIVQKAREKKAFMLKLLFNEEPLPFSIHDAEIAWLHANGVIDKVNENADILVPLYKKALITAFRPLINGETSHYINSPQDSINQYLTTTGDLNLKGLLDAYRLYVRRRGFRAFDTQQLKEGAWHYSLDGFIYFFIERLGGRTYIEVPSGRGRTDILIRYQDKSYLIETKVYSDETYFQRGKKQLAEYLNSEALAEGYYVVFSKIHTQPATLNFEEQIQGKQIYTYIIPTQFEQPSRLQSAPAAKLSEAEKIACNMLKIGTLTIEQIAQATGIKTTRVEQLRDEL